MTNTVEQTLYKMLTANTGRAICDSGGAYGRNWERNQGKTLANFENEAPAFLSIGKWHDGTYSFDVTISVFHRITSLVESNIYCDEFNSQPVDDWRGDYYGTSEAGQTWLEDNGFTPSDCWGDGFNTYNFDGCLLSQTLQGHILDHESGDKYILLQVHGGCDVRGGYTDAKLFKLRQWVEPWQIADDYAMFTLAGEVCDYRGGDGGFTDENGDPITDEKLQKYAQAVGECLIRGDIAE